MRLDIVISGVGGQGTVLASRIIAQAAMEAGMPVRTSETIGMAQREGTVTSHVRMGEPLCGALITDQGAGVLLGFELAETVRWLHKLKPGGWVLANTAMIVPVSVAAGRSTYDAEALENYLRQQVPNLLLFDATKLAVEAGSHRATNTVLLGALSAVSGFPVKHEELLKAALAIIPAKLREVNEKAFSLGRQAAEV